MRRQRKSHTNPRGRRLPSLDVSTAARHRFADMRSVGVVLADCLIGGA